MALKKSVGGLFARIFEWPDGSFSETVMLIDAAGNPVEAAQPLGHQSVTVTLVAATLGELLAAAGGPIAAIPEGTKLIYLQPRADGIRYAHGGATPTTSAGIAGIGTAIFQDGQYPVPAARFATLKFVAAGNTVLSLEFLG